MGDCPRCKTGTFRLEHAFGKLKGWHRCRECGYGPDFPQYLRDMRQIQRVKKADKTLAKTAEDGSH